MTTGEHWAAVRVGRDIATPRAYRSSMNAHASSGLRSRIVNDEPSPLRIDRLRGALGATVHGLDVDAISAETDGPLAAELRRAWAEHLVLFFPGIHLTPAQQVCLAGVFGPRLAATTEIGADYRNTPTMADDGFPQILLLDTARGQVRAATNVWHTDVTFIEHPPIGSLFAMEVAAASGGDTMWSNQYLSYEGLSAPVRRLVDGLEAVHGRPPMTSTATHPAVKVHPETGRTHLNVNRGWTTSLKGISSVESRHLLDLLFERSERPENQVRWQWTSGDAALWDNRCTMHYAVDDYGSEHRRARRVTIYDA